MDKTVDLVLREWSRRGPDSDPRLRELRLPDAGPSRILLERLQSEKVLEVLELASGPEVRTTSYVGSVRIGPLHVRVRPKTSQDALLVLMRYAYGLRRLKLFSEQPTHVHDLGIQDLLVAQLETECRELLARGLHRNYLPEFRVLTSPAGRIDFAGVVSRAGMSSADLPCHIHERTEDCLQNRVILAGLRLAARVAADPSLRSRVRNTARLLTANISPVELTSDLFGRVDRADNRLVSRYRPIVKLVRLIFGGYAATMLEGERHSELPGFMLDMNLFFQDLVGRFLRENLEAHTVLEQSSLVGVFGYERGFNPFGWKARQPKPDFVVTGPGSDSQILDAKYIDLSENPLPREILYQMTIYALLKKPPRTAVVLYPTSDPNAEEARIVVREPLAGVDNATVILRPLHMPTVAELVAERPTAVVDRRRRQYAGRLVFGTA